MFGKYHTLLWSVVFEILVATYWACCLSGVGINSSVVQNW